MLQSARIKSTILSTPGIWTLLIPLKLMSYWRSNLKPQILLYLKCAFASRELTNHSYHNSEISIKRLAIMLANVEGISVSAIQRYCREIKDSPALQDIYLNARAREKMLHNLTDGELRAGRQLLYYCLTRALKPAVVFEAGTAHGTGSLLMLHALKLNALEGFHGRLTTVDINPNAGKILNHLPRVYSALLDARKGNTEQVLAGFEQKIDLFFHDTVNVAAHESKHYDLLGERLSDSGVVCSTWGTSGVLATYSRRRGRAYLEFTNQSSDHWCNDTVGISLPLALRAGHAGSGERRVLSKRIPAAVPGGISSGIPANPAPEFDVVVPIYRDMAPANQR